jgi:hypothetical protein
MGPATGARPRPSLALLAGFSSLSAGSIAALMAAAVVVLAAAGALGLLRGNAGRHLQDALLGPILLIVWSHGLEPVPAWNHPSVMYSAIAGSPKVYALPALSVALGVLGRWLSGRGTAPGAETLLARAARRHSRAGIIMGATAALSLFGLFLVYRL